VSRCRDGIEPRPIGVARLEDAKSRAAQRAVGRDDVVVITGASRGLGRAVALAAAARGARVALLARSTIDLDAVATLTGGLPLRCDVGDPVAVRAAIDAVVDRFGRVDLVVANAGIGAYGPFTDVADETLDSLVRTNVLGVMHTVRAAVAPMTAVGRGRIVLVGSIAGRVGVPLEAAYSATKHAVDGLGRALAAELAPDGITVSVVNFGPLDTGFASRAGHAYTRRRPRPMPVERAAAAVLAAADRRTVESIVPRWLRISVITDALAPRLYLRGAERACAGELRGFRDMRKGNESAAGAMTTVSAAEQADLLARAGQENFRVAPRFLPATVRRDLMALYGYARLVDWIGDEYEGDRLAMLDWAATSIDRAASGDDDVATVFARAGATVRRHDLALQPFHDLIEANRRDQVVRRYATFADLVDYCRLSANPVGRMVLGVLGSPTPATTAWSDDVCTALQVVEHCQDVGEDARAGRIYLPADDLASHGVVEDDLLAATASAGLRAVVLTQTDRARALLASGPSLTATLTGRNRLLVGGFVAGGMATVDAIERVGGDVLGHRCRPTTGRTLVRLGEVLRPARAGSAAA
jgi:squalene synthase HpnC